jgi:hypothetical protein
MAAAAPVTRRSVLIGADQDRCSQHGTQHAHTHWKR